MICNTDPRHGMADTQTDPRERLNSWKEIAAYLNRSVRTVIRWEDEQGLPVHRQVHDKRGAVHAYKAELDAWVQKRTVGPESAEAGPDADALPRRRWNVWASAAAIIAIGIFAAVSAWFVLAGPGPLPAPQTRPLTTYPGSEMYPALSPDGDRVVFAWDHEEAGHFDLYEKQVGSDAPPVRLTAKPAALVYPAWSPDGQRIAMARALGEGRFALGWVPAGGGEERHVAEILTDFTPSITWTPDGQWLVTPHRPGRQEPAGLYLVAANGGEMRRIQTGVPREIGDRQGSFSPDGRWLALAHRPTFTSESIYVIPVSRDWQAAGPAAAMDRAVWCCSTQLIWTPDRRQLLYSKLWESVVSLWGLSVPRGTPHAVIGAGPLGTGGVAFSARRKRLAYSDYRSGPRIWRLGLGVRGASPEPYLSSQGYERSPAISPDGRQVAFTSSRVGRAAIWICDADGRNERPLTQIGGGAPRWSPDGRQIAFDAVVDGKEDIYVAAVPEGRTRRVTNSAGQAVLPTWSADGDWIYYCLTQKGQGQAIWKTRADGQGAPARVTDGWMAQEAPDGRTLYVTKANYGSSQVNLWKKPLPGGPETLLVRSVGNIRNFVVTRDGIYHDANRSAHSFAILFHRFSNGRSEVIAEIGRTPFEGLALGRGGGWLLFSSIEEHPGDLWVVDNFR
jgi:Tol biopolymer transport system component